MSAVPAAEPSLKPAKTRVDRVALKKESRYPSAIAGYTRTAARMGTQGAPNITDRLMSDVELSCACFSGTLSPSRRSGRSALPPKRHPRVVQSCIEAALAASRGPIGIGAQLAEMPPWCWRPAAPREIRAG